MNGEKVMVDLDAIPEYVRPYLLAPFFAAAKEYFKQPGVQEKYERWLEARKATAQEGE